MLEDGGGLRTGHKDGTRAAFSLKARHRPTIADKKTEQKSPLGFGMALPESVARHYSPGE
jgi:hypothetical protein